MRENCCYNFYCLHFKNTFLELINNLIFMQNLKKIAPKIKLWPPLKICIIGGKWAHLIIFPNSKKESDIVPIKVPFTFLTLNLLGLAFTVVYKSRLQSALNITNCNYLAPVKILRSCSLVNIVSTFCVQYSLNVILLLNK